MKFKNLFSKIKIQLSFKARLILIIISITLLLTIVGVGAFIFQQMMISKLSLMVETTISSNEIVKIAQEIPYCISAYDLYKEDQNIIDINRFVSQIKSKMNFIRKNVHGDAQLSYYTLNGLLNGQMKAFLKLIPKSINYMENGGKLRDTDYLTELNQNLSMIRTTVQQLIANELSDYYNLKEKLDRQRSIIEIIVILAFLIIGGLSMSAAIININGIANPIIGIAHSASQIADGDLQVKALEVKSNDEISILAQSFNKMAENLRSLIGSINSHSTQVATTAEHLKLGAEQSSTASEQIALTIQQVSEGASEQAFKSQQTAEAAKRLFQSNQKVIGNAGEVITAADRASYAAREGNVKIIGLIEQIAKIEEEISSIQLTTDRLKKRSDEIGEILLLMTEMAEQISLLSLNASIEAARAGELGVGFAVVANQVRKIAEDSTNAVNSISDILCEIQIESLEVTRKVSSGVEEVVTGTKMARDAMVAFEKIVDTSVNADAKVKEISVEIQKMVEEIHKVQAMSESIASIAMESSAESEEVAAAAEEQTSGSEEILSSASLLHDLAEGLQGLVQKFKV